MNEFSSEPNKSIRNIYNRDILSDDIPNQAPISLGALDGSGAWQDSDGANFAPSRFDNGDVKSSI